MSSPQMHSKVEPLKIKKFRCLWICSDELAETEDLCNETFYSSVELTTHLARQHVGKLEDEFVCRWQNCFRKGREYDVKNLLKEHVRSHSGVKHYQCYYEGCTARFTYRKSLRGHVKTKHADGRGQINAATVNINKNGGQNVVVSKRGL